MGNGMERRERRFARRSAICLMQVVLFDIIMLTSQGCLECRYLYKFNLDGTCDFDYLAKGDSADIYEPAGSAPDTLFFKVKTWTELDTANREVYLLEATGRFSPDSLPANLGLKGAPWTSVFLQHPARLVRTPLFFLNIYKFQGSFRSRDRTATEGDPWDFIPEECRVLEGGEDSLLTQADRAVLEEKYAAGLLIWNMERYKRRFRQILQTVLEEHPAKAPVRPEWVDSALTEVDSLMDTYATSIPTENIDLVNLEWWKNLSPQANLILTENLNSIGDSVSLAEIERVGDIMELRHRVNEDLLDDSFEVRADLPGRVVSSNASAMEVGVLLWKFLGEDLQDKDYDMQAVSIYIFPARVVGVLVLILALYLGMKFRKTGERKEPAEPPPPPSAR